MDLLQKIANCDGSSEQLDDIKHSIAMLAASCPQEVVSLWGSKNSRSTVYASYASLRLICGFFRWLILIGHFFYFYDLKQEKLFRASLIPSICGGYLDLVELLISKGSDVGCLPDAVSSKLL